MTRSPSPPNVVGESKPRSKVIGVADVVLEQGRACFASRARRGKRGLRRDVRRREGAPVEVRVADPEVERQVLAGIRCHVSPNQMAHVGRGMWMVQSPTF